MTDTTQNVSGGNAPAAGTWQIDPSHSSVAFYVRHLGLSKVRGQFERFSGTIDVAERAEDSSVLVEIDAASIDTREPKRDAHLRSADFLEVEAYPTLQFRSTAVRLQGERVQVSGDLTVRGVTRPVILDATLEGVVGDPFGGTRLAFSASGEVDREAFGLTWNQALEAGGFLVGKKVRIDLDVEAVQE